ncbi:MAG: transglycosylase SLT domain-containing protein [Prolixibacteraceae bacterium]|nr:transglycosylase SLT domain-containing protein [Prolixibacteraceae bacterium]
MKFIQPIILSIISTLLFNTVAANNHPNGLIMPMQRVELTGIDSLGNLDTIKAYSDEIQDFLFAAQMDSLMNNWYVRNAYNIDSMVIPDPDSTFLLFNEDVEMLHAPLSDSVYIARLSALNAYIDLSYNKTVGSVISLYTERKRNQVAIMLGLANYYFPIFEEILDKYNLPIELKYMAIIESALNARAFSRAGACGLWQFMYGTGKMYGLEINSFVDERRDPVKATDAAARYLSDLYAIYQDWHLVIAAYNCGPGNVNKAIRRSGGTRDYWTIYYRLPKETRGYVPAFIAAAYTMNYYKLHGIVPQQASFNIITDTIMINNYLHFEQVSAQLGLDIEMIRDMNPMYRRDIIPATQEKPYPLCLPQESVLTFIQNEQPIFSYKREEFFPNNKIKDPAQTAYQYVPGDIKGKEKVFYTVKSGDNIGFISQWFKVRTADLRYWNNIHGNLIRVGQKLVIYVPSGKGEYFKDFNAMSFEEKQKSIGAVIPATQTASNTQLVKDDAYLYYTVKKGDNLWTIAQQFPGVSAENIQKLNNISNTKGLSIGQQLKIKRK